MENIKTDHIKGAAGGEDEEDKADMIGGPILNGAPYRGGMSRGPRPQIQATSREEPREAGFYVRPVGFDADVDVGGRAACRIARVKIDQIFDEGSGVQYEQSEMEEMPDLVSE